MVIDVGAVSSDRDLHDVLKRELGFPAFYGMNWAAFWDAITGLDEMPRMLRFIRWAELERRAPLAAAALRAQLVRYETTTEGFSVVYDQ
ncbi:barstar family protein [Streptomyces sp. URMC 123]|uniref:barstar family protein n=1 Tax=Streptomyces sp. URMC 123 TaxID=3423403 RepID=UPI003F1CB52E